MGKKIIIDTFLNSFGQQISLPTCCAFVGKQNSGKTYLCKQILSFLLMKRKFKYGHVFCSDKMTFNNFISSEFIHNYDHAKEQNKNEVFVNQIQRILDFQTYFNNPPCFIIFDDAFAHLSGLMNNRVIQQLFAEYRHFNISIFLTFQHIKAIKPIFRASINHLFVFRITNNVVKQAMLEIIESLHDSKDEAIENISDLKDHEFIYYNLIEDSYKKAKLTKKLNVRAYF